MSKIKDFLGLKNGKIDLIPFKTLQLHGSFCIMLFERISQSVGRFAISKLHVSGDRFFMIPKLTNIPRGIHYFPMTMKSPNTGHLFCNETYCFNPNSIMTPRKEELIFFV